MNLLLLLWLPLATCFSLSINFGRPREVNVLNTVTKATLLMSRVKGMKNFGEIMNLISRLNKVNTMQSNFLSNSHRANDNELVDIINKINNLVMQMSNMSDSEIARGKGFGALVLASNDLDLYLKQNQPAWMNYIPDFDFADPAKGVDDINSVIPDMDMGFGSSSNGFSGWGSTRPGGTFGTFYGSSYLPGGFNFPSFG